MSEVQTEQRSTSAEIKKQIEAAQKAEREQKTKTELLQSGLPLPAIADRINANSTTEAPKAASKSEPAFPPAQPAAEKETASKESVELKEWAKKKGINWETSDSVLIELRKKDQEFHRKIAERKREAAERPPVAPTWTPPQSYQPSYQPGPSYPTYQNRQVIEDLARQYNVPPEDFERITAIQRDLTAAMLGEERQRHQRELDEMKRENVKNSEFRELSADPVFRRPEVAKEFHDVLEQMQESDPDSFSQDPYAYRKAFGQALQNIGRRNLEGSVTYGRTDEFQLPTNPPKPLGQGAGGGRDINENGITQADFERMSVEDKRAYFASRGLIAPKY